ncbi:S-adenosyl-L-methionine-dependent methyltransferase [Thelonectria olida]|uniref:S-adenosyl-L-methionine-dependent methyltransferase n=1 Tax=Thelonectria olida TaxID=1576542 RepID=A0A9P8WFN6_9HYPO|nr:S-adenosyl-L-methionine-dependent methyltransferase [Thelonectria olida]
MLSTTRTSSRLLAGAARSSPIPLHIRTASAISGRRYLSQDWSSTQYLKFANQRTRPALDLLAQVPLESPNLVLDVGCGPGNSTEILVSKYPNAAIEGIDSSPDMIAKARNTVPSAQFSLADLTSYTVPKPMDLIFSNAVLHWVKADDRIPTMKKMIQSLRPGGVFAMQVPDNYHERSHAAMRAVANDGPWAEILRQLKPALDPFSTPLQIYNELSPLCSSVDIWHTFYQHPLDSHQGIVEWVKGTGLRPFLDPLTPEHSQGFLDKYLAKLKEEYETSVDGKVLLRYPRLFIVAVRA